MAKITFLNIFVFIMELFYTTNIIGNSAILDQQESIHCTKVLRHKSGDFVNFTDGKGYLYYGKLLESRGKEATIEILGREEGTDSRPYYLQMAVALTKNYERFEWFLEKAVEIGVDRVTPLVCDHSERRVFKYERAQRLIHSASKQSLKTFFPVLDDITKASQFITTLENPSENSSHVSLANFKNTTAIKIMGHCREGEKESITSILGVIKENWAIKTDSQLKQDGIDKPHIIIMIGPEGDFSVEEIELALKSEFKIMHLGNSRMRVETAAVTSVSAVYLNYLDIK